LAVRRVVTDEADASIGTPKIGDLSKSSRAARILRTAALQAAARSESECAGDELTGHRIRRGCGQNARDPFRLRLRRAVPYRGFVIRCPPRQLQALAMNATVCRLEIGDSSREGRLEILEICATMTAVGCSRLEPQGVPVFAPGTRKET